MSLVMVDVDRWVTLGTTGYEMCLRRDDLADPDYRIRVETTYFGGLHVRTLAPVPAGFWLRPIGQRELWLPPQDRYTTQEFRLDQGDC